MITLGCDPEFFLQEAGGSFKSAIGVIDGVKGKPISIPDGAYHVDNVAAEINIVPADSEELFLGNIKSVVSHVEGLVKKKGYIIAKQQVAEFSLEELLHPDAMAAGCEIDYNAYADNPKVPNEPKTYAFQPLRVVGGHIHIGFKKEDKIDPIALLKTLDIFLTLPMLPHEDERRRQFYGLAGDFRWKPYGVEYRTPSNVWTYTEASIKWAYRQVHEAIKRHKEGINIPNIQEIINQHKVDVAKEICINLNITPMEC
jgi:hypothetical protein